jgi:uncharacterized membrane protein YdcZ (DUF606 family)
VVARLQDLAVSSAEGEALIIAGIRETVMKIGAVVSIVALVGMQIVLGANVAHAGVAHVPEPTSLTLLGVGAAAVAVGAWWRNRK